MEVTAENGMARDEIKTNRATGSGETCYSLSILPVSSMKTSSSDGLRNCISFSSIRRTPEADVCAMAFTAACTKLDNLLKGSFSGQYLVEHDLGEDIAHAAQLNKYTVVPCMRNGEITAV